MYQLWRSTPEFRTDFIGGLTIAPEPSQVPCKGLMLHPLYLRVLPVELFPEIHAGSATLYPK